MTGRQRLTLIATILGSGIVFLDATVVNVALPTIQDDLHTGLAGQQWVVEAYMLTLVSLLLVGGSLGDLFGRRRMFVSGLVGFAACSVLCAIAPTDEALVAPGLCRGSPARCWSRDRWRSSPRRSRARRAARRWAVDGLGWYLNPVRPGGWRPADRDRLAVHLLGQPAAGRGHRVAGAARGAESSDPEAVRGIDGVGILLSALGLAGPTFALIEQPLYGFADPLVWAPLVGGLVCLAGSSGGSRGPGRRCCPCRCFARTTSPPSTSRPSACTPGSAGRRSSSPSSCSRWRATAPSRPARRRPRSR